MSEDEVILASACLAGLNCRHDGSACPDKEVVALFRQGRVVPLCPEQLGGLPTPRPAAQIASGDGKDVLDGDSQVMNEEGENVTSRFLSGAEEVLKVVRLLGIRKAVLKDKSPSCGFGTIYRGGELVAGSGVCAVLLAREGLEIVPRE